MTPDLSTRIVSPPPRGGGGFSTFKLAVISFLRSDCANLSAAIAFYSLLSLFPLHMFLISLSGFLIREFSLQQTLIHQASSLLPTGADWVRDNLVSISKNFGRVQLFSLFLLWWSASGVFLPMETALNRAWRVPCGRSYWRRHVLALGMTLACGTLLSLSLLTTAVQRWMAHHRLVVQLPREASAFFSISSKMLFLATPFLFSILTFLLIYKIVPNRPIQIRDVRGAALLSAFLWEIAKYAFAALLPFFNYRHLYGSLSAAVALMMWGYISSLLLLFGAEFAAATTHGRENTLVG